MAYNGCFSLSERCMRRILTVSLSLAAMLTAAPAMADWQGKVEAGVVFSRGNTETTTANGKLDMANDLEKWKHAALLAALYAENENSLTGEAETSAERYEARWQSDYKFTPPGGTQASYPATPAPGAYYNGRRPDQLLASQIARHKN